MEPGKRELVHLRDGDSGVDIYGHMTWDKDGGDIAGIGVGITTENYNKYRPFELRGSSASHENVWLIRIHNYSVKATNQGLCPTIVSFEATTLYYGKFDPRTPVVRYASLSLASLPNLCKEPLKTLNLVPEDRSTYITIAKANVAPIVLFADRETEITLEYPESIGDDISHEQRLNVSFPQGTSSLRADALMDAVLILFFVLTGCSVESWPRSYQSETGMAFQLSRSRVDNGVLHSFEWLVPFAEIIALMQSMMPSWLKHVGASREAAPARRFYYQDSHKLPMEAKFLAYCQCFEELNSRRCPGKSMSDADFEEKVAGPLSELNEKLKINKVNKKIRQKLLHGIGSANALSLEERLRDAFSKEPLWRERVNSPEFNIFTRIARRRNQISHGNPEGDILSQEDAIPFYLERNVIYLHCLSEILFLGGLDEDAVVKLVNRSRIVRELKHLLKADPPLPGAEY